MLTSSAGYAGPAWIQQDLFGVFRLTSPRYAKIVGTETNVAAQAPGQNTIGLTVTEHEEEPS